MFLFGELDLGSRVKWVFWGSGDCCYFFGYILNFLLVFIWYLCMLMILCCFRFVVFMKFELGMVFGGYWLNCMFEGFRVIYMNFCFLVVVLFFFFWKYMFNFKKKLYLMRDIIFGLDLWGEGGINFNLFGFKNI